MNKWSEDSTSSHLKESLKGKQGEIQGLIEHDSCNCIMLIKNEEWTMVF